jgi:hypothetical protein
MRMRVMIAALLTLLPLAASAAEKKNCPNGNPVFVEPEGEYAGKSELRFGPHDPDLPANIGTMTLTAGGKSERYYIPNNAGHVYVVHLDNEKISSQILFFSRSLVESSEDDAALVHIPDLQIKRRKLLPGSGFIGRTWHFKKCEPAKQSSNAPAQ